MFEKEDGSPAISAEKQYKTDVENAEDYVENFDILETITNVGNDEVFTPVATCKAMLDALPSDVWNHPEYKWLNPVTKNGVFEREIAIRLNDSPAIIAAFPNELDRKKHILTEMIYAIGETKFTARVARRTLYYCDDATRKCDGLRDPNDGHFINGFAIGDGNWFDRSEGNVLNTVKEHSFGLDHRCTYCGIAKTSKYNDDNQVEHYAYDFIHMTASELQAYFRQKFFKGDWNMHFDIIIGNPPYQLADGGAQASASPIYQKFVSRAIELKPRYLSMIVPSRWFTGGKGLDDFRETMLRDTRLSCIHDFPNADDCFHEVDIKGGVNYFVWEREHKGNCDIYTHKGKEIISHSKRPLLEGSCDVFIRNNNLVSIFKKVHNLEEPSFKKIVSPRKPYGLSGDIFKDPQKYGLPPLSNDPITGGLVIYGLDYSLKRVKRYVPSDYPVPRKDTIKDYKMFMARNQGSGIFGETFTTPVFGGPGDLCTETFVVIGPFKTKEETLNCWSYIRTKFFRAMVGVKKNDQGAAQGVYEYVPLQDFSHPWSDKELYEKYGLSNEDISFIEANVQDMSSPSFDGGFSDD